MKIKLKESANENERRKYCLKLSIVEDGRDGHFFSHAILSAAHVSSHLLRPNARVSQEAVWLHTGVSSGDVIPAVDAAQ